MKYLLLITLLLVSSCKEPFAIKITQEENLRSNKEVGRYQLSQLGAKFYVLDSVTGEIWESFFDDTVKRTWMAKMSMESEAPDHTEIRKTQSCRGKLPENMRMVAFDNPAKLPKDLLLQYGECMGWVQPSPSPGE